MTKGFVTLENGQQVHYRKIGNGPPLVMLHASPQCSEALLPAAQYFSSLCTCLALDSPGYGYSDNLGILEPSIGDYADILVQAIDQMGIHQFYLYGVATGSQIAIEIGKRHPDRVKFLMLDSNGHVSDEAREQILDGYFPSVKPMRGGGHLLTYWEMCRSLFVAFPWTSGKIADAFPMPLPSAGLIHNACMRYLRAGEDYALAYNTAFHIEKRDHMDGLNVPTVMTRWEGSLVVSIADDLINLGLPECVRVLYAGAGFDARYNVQVEALRDALLEHKLPLFESAPDQAIRPIKLSSSYYDSGSLQIHIRHCPSEFGRPLICVHDAHCSTRQFEAFLKPILGLRPIYLIDLPCHGLSDHFPNDTQITTEELAAPLAQFINSIDAKKCDIVGIGLGGSVAAQTNLSSSIHHLHIINPVRYSKEQEREYLEKGIVELTPQKDGTHLIRAWTIARDKELYKPWYDAKGASRLNRDANLNPSYLHDKTVDLLRTGSRYPDIEVATVSIDWSDIFENLTIPYTRANNLEDVDFN